MVEPEGEPEEEERERTFFFCFSSMLIEIEETDSFSSKLVFLARSERVQLRALVIAIRALSKCVSKGGERCAAKWERGREETKKRIVVF